MKYLCLVSQKNFFPGLLNLCAQVRCALNWYTAVQTDLTYPHYVPHYHYKPPCAAILENVRGATLELPHVELLTEKDSTYLMSHS